MESRPIKSIHVSYCTQPQNRPQTYLTPARRPDDYFGLTDMLGMTQSSFYGDNVSRGPNEQIMHEVLRDAKDDTVLLLKRFVLHSLSSSSVSCVPPLQQARLSKEE